MKNGCLKRCLYCGKTFYEYPYLKGKRKYCSRDCSNKSNAQKLSESRKGKGNPMYKKKPWNYIDGKSGGRKVDIKYWKWKRAVHERDGYICQKCRKKLPRKLLIAHHIKSWKNYPRLRYVVSNGLTLCRTCHNKIDKNIKEHQYE
jgi:hypothetical protein